MYDATREPETHRMASDMACVDFRVCIRSDTPCSCDLRAYSLVTECLVRMRSFAITRTADSWFCFAICFISAISFFSCDCREERSRSSSRMAVCKDRRLRAQSLHGASRMPSQRAHLCQDFACSREASQRASCAAEIASSFASLRNLRSSHRLSEYLKQVTRAWAVLTTRSWAKGH